MRSWLAIGSLLLVAGSWRLWTPQQLFPRVPLLSFALSWSESVDQLLTWACLGLWGMVTLALAWPKLPLATSRIAAILYAVLFCLLVILDQHRLQPWGVHIAICLLIVTAFRSRQLLSWLMAFSASIYIYSALSKFDAQFLHTVGQDFLAGLLLYWPGSYAALSDTARFMLAACFPIGELLCGLGLLWNGTRKLALACGIGMHATLIVILGPWGLAHSWGVLLWNLVFIGLNVLVWRSLTAETQAAKFSYAWFSDTTQHWRSVGRNCVSVIVIVAMTLPISERLGLIDHWLGWALYAPHSSRARIELISGAAERQSAIVQRFVQKETDLSPWENVAVDRWSLETLGVPIYPQQRFYVGVARALASRDEFGVRVTLLGTANRWTGARKQRVLDNRDELTRAAFSYWFNTTPRW